MLASSARIARATVRARTLGRTLATVADSSGIKIAAVDHGEPTTSVTLIARAGTRFETKPGVAQVLKNYAFKSTGPRSALRTVREAELYGGVLSSSLTREYLTFTAEFLRGDTELFSELLLSLMHTTKFLPHELAEDVLPVVNAEAAEARSDPVQRALELAHALAFRSGLGAPLHAPAHGVVNVADVKAYADAVFSAGNIAAVGTGISEAALTQALGGPLRPASGDTLSAPATQCFGGEAREEASAHGAPPTIFVGFAASGAPSAELRTLAAHLDPLPSVKWASGTSPLAGALPEGSAARAVLLPYSDATLMGVLVAGATVDIASKAARATVDVLQKSAGAALAAEDFKAAVGKAKFRAAQATEGHQGQVFTLGPELLGHKPVKAAEAISALDGLSASSVTKVAADLLKSKPVFVAIGPQDMPYADQLGL